MHFVKQGGRVHDGEDGREGGALRYTNRLVPFFCKEVVEPKAYFPVSKESPCPRSQRGVEAHCGDDCREAIMIDMIEEAFYVKEKHAAFEA